MATLNWIGKEAVVNHHRKVPYRLLKADPSLSVGEDGGLASGNLLVQGDNLEALKALLPYYGGKVKCIYIDPPYNTGNEEWVYNDNVNSPQIRAWLEGTLESRKVDADDLSRHDKWLCMMYPRLMLLRDFLCEDGALFVSIDDNEVAFLRLLLDEVLGSSNFVAEMIWEGAFKNDARQIGVNHEYVLVYAKNRALLPREWAVPKEGVEPVLREVDRLRAIHGEDYDSASADLAGWFRAMKATPSFGLRRFRFIDARGAYKEDDPTAPGGRRFQLINPHTGTVIPLRPNRGWAFDQNEFEERVKQGRISFVNDKSIMLRTYLHETDKVTPQSVFYQPTRSASERLGRILDSGEFEYPKDEVILQRFIDMATDPGAIVMDSFAGSGTTGHAVLAMNKADGGNRKFICIEMDETICKTITRERITRVIEGYHPGGDRKKERVEGLGGGFRYVTLGPTLFDEHGRFRSGEDKVTFGQLAAHIFFTQTGEPLPKQVNGKRSPLIGTFRGTAYYLLYNGILGDRSVSGGNVLTRETLAMLPKHTLADGSPGPRVVFGEACRLSDATLRREGIEFRQIPYQVEVG
ncbi:MAG: site-specific DNA-methyltransferase [Phycisphaeraceae bacterium]|nr:MAG: site-specific DNA-methyltransferase [Phycisphaeraceae bacterium]